MKQIEYCLDELLKKLEDNWNQPGDRLPLDWDAFLRGVDFPPRSEYFFELIDILIEDKYVTISTEGFEKANKMYLYEKRTIISAKGLLFLKQGGYQQKLNDDVSLRQRVALLETRTYYIAFAVGVVTALYFLWDITKWIVERLDMVFCSCP